MWDERSSAAILSNFQEPRNTPAAGYFSKKAGSDPPPALSSAARSDERITVCPIFSRRVRCFHPSAVFQVESAAWTYTAGTITNAGTMTQSLKRVSMAGHLDTPRSIHALRLD